MLEKRKKLKRRYFRWLRRPRDGKDEDLKKDPFAYGMFKLGELVMTLSGIGFILWVIWFVFL